MAKIRANGIDIEYESHGSERDPALLLVMGLGAQLTVWPLPFVEALVARGFRVIRFDNRDVGLSTKIERAGVPNLYAIVAQQFLRFRPQVPYTIADMAEDAAGLLDALGIARVHVVGASMGGMIAQHLAARHPKRVLSLTSMMSTTGNPMLPMASFDAMRALIRRPRSQDIDALIAHGMELTRTIAGPGYPMDEEVLRARVRENIERASYAPGFTRQLAAIIADGDRRPMLRRLRVPTAVIHGTSDPLIPLACGRDTAANIPGARLVELERMGHSLPLELVPAIVDAIAAVTEERLAA